MAQKVLQFEQFTLLLSKQNFYKHPLLLKISHKQQVDKTIFAAKPGPVIEWRNQTLRLVVGRESEVQVQVYESGSSLKSIQVFESVIEGIIDIRNLGRGSNIRSIDLYHQKQDEPVAKLNFKVLVQIDKPRKLSIVKQLPPQPPKNVISKQVKSNQQIQVQLINRQNTEVVHKPKAVIKKERIASAALNSQIFKSQVQFECLLKINSIIGQLLPSSLSFKKTKVRIRSAGVSTDTQFALNRNCQPVWVQSVQMLTNSKSVVRFQLLEQQQFLGVGQLPLKGLNIQSRYVSHKIILKKENVEIGIIFVDVCLCSVESHIQKQKRSQSRYQNKKIDLQKLQQSRSSSGSSPGKYHKLIYGSHGDQLFSKAQRFQYNKGSIDFLMGRISDFEKKGRGFGFGSSNRPTPKRGGPGVGMYKIPTTFDKY